MSKQSDDLKEYFKNKDFFFPVSEIDMCKWTKSKNCDAVIGKSEVEVVDEECLPHWEHRISFPHFSKNMSAMHCSTVHA